MSPAGEVLPLLYLHGLSSGDFVPALEQFLGTSAGLSAATVTRLTAQWQGDYKTFYGRDMSTVDYVYVWADGIHVNGAIFTNGKLVERPDDNNTTQAAA